MGWGDSACGSCASSATSKGHVLFWEGGPSRPPWCASTSGLMAVWILKRLPGSLVSRASAFGNCVSSVASRGHVLSWESGPSHLPWCASPPVRCHVVDREHTPLNLARSLPSQISLAPLCWRTSRVLCRPVDLSHTILAHPEISRRLVCLASVRATKLLSKGLATDHCESQNRCVCRVRCYSASNLHCELSPVHGSNSHTPCSDTQFSPVSVHESSHSGSRPPSRLLPRNKTVKTPRSPECVPALKDTSATKLS